ncbi:peptidylprolyl isomerase [Bradyrhizobium betae]|uniref:Parvulin-like PPIase n=2 Tax=Bradyrhizobium betae TaxID=244734 RepID=A0A4Q1UQ31_9BRAD|nr:peptidylprolyl isomerase [Bradyrhizobium betae]
MKVMSASRASNPLATARARTAAILLAAVLGTTGQTLAQSATTDRVVAIVNGTQIHESDIKVTDDMVGRNLNSQDPVERHDIILKMYIDTLLLSKVATDRKIVDEADIQRRVTFARNQGLMNNLLAGIGQQAVTDESIRKAYEEVVVKPANNEPELQLRHIFFLFKDPKDDAAVKGAEEKANAAFKRIKAGEDFAAVAADVSEDPITKAKGGEFGWRGRAEMGEEYAKIAFTMKKGEVSEPLKTAVGWHIVKVEDQRTRTPIALEQIRGRVAAMVAANAQFEFVDKLRAEAKIDRFDAQQASDNAAPKQN